MPRFRYSIALFLAIFILPLQPLRSFPSTSKKPTSSLPRQIPGDNTTISLPLVLKNGCQPAIAFTSIPTYDTYEDLHGLVACASPASYKVAVYIYYDGWKTKPYLASPLTPIENDGTWVCDVSTQQYDPMAVRIAAFLVPNGYNPPLMSGGAPLPPDIFAHAIASVVQDRVPSFRQVQFSGYTWNVKYAETTDGPGPNYYSARPEDVWVDQNGRLHLKVANHNGRWYSTEVFTTVPFGYGTYTFTLASRPDVIDKNAVLGLFHWDEFSPQYNYREIDIEFSKWAQDLAENSQYVIQPWDNPGNLHRFNIVSQGDTSLHRFTWNAAGVSFASYQGLSPSPGSLIDEWNYNGDDIPLSGGGQVRLDLWLFQGLPPSNGQEQEVVIDSFSFHSP